MNFNRVIDIVELRNESIRIRKKLRSIGFNIDSGGIISDSDLGCELPGDLPDRATSIWNELKGM